MNAAPDQELLNLLRAIVQKDEAMAVALRTLAQENAKLREVVMKMRTDVDGLIRRGNKPGSL